jgi:hypothetical protein
LLSSSTTSGFEGVCKLKNGKYSATVKENDKKLHLGSFSTAEVAALVCARRVMEYRVWAEAAEVAAVHRPKKQKV